MIMAIHTGQTGKVSKRKGKKKKSLGFWDEGPILNINM